MREHLVLFHQNFWKHFDKIALIWLFMICFGGAVFLMDKPSMDEGTVDWARAITGNVLSGLLGLVGGTAIGRAIAQSEKPESKPENK